MLEPHLDCVFQSNLFPPGSLFLSPYAFCTKRSHKALGQAVFLHSHSSLSPQILQENVHFSRTMSSWKPLKSPLTWPKFTLAKDPDPFGKQTRKRGKWGQGSERLCLCGQRSRVLSQLPLTLAGPEFLLLPDRSVVTRSFCSARGRFSRLRSSDAASRLSLVTVTSASGGALPVYVPPPLKQNSPTYPSSAICLPATLIGSTALVLICLISACLPSIIHVSSTHNVRFSTLFSLFPPRFTPVFALSTVLMWLGHRSPAV